LRLVTDDSELATTREVAQAAAATGIAALPFFVFGERIAVRGAQPRRCCTRQIETRPWRSAPPARATPRQPITSEERAACGRIVVVLVVHRG
jgi:predicted DsbA family dithiol-disulfide isomerase